MATHLSKATLLVLILSAIIKGYEASTNVIDSTKSQCVPKSCLNGGKRIDLADGTYRCSCMSGFTGIICETDFQWLCKNSCLHGGTQIDQSDGGYRCNCTTGFTRIKCKTESHSVCENSCLNGGTRNNLPNGGYRCDCVEQFTGIICETDATTMDDTTTDATTMDETTTEATTMDETTTDATTTAGVTRIAETTTNAITTGYTGCRNYTADGDDKYIGNHSWTITKKTCQRWDSQNIHNYNAALYDGNITNISQAENYCRNPDDKPGGPWCFTTDPSMRWQYCDVPFCHGCQHTEIGADYNGTINWADTMHCLHWEDVHHSFTPANFAGGIMNLSQAEDYCRNPNNQWEGPWCYVNETDGVWPRTCTVPPCQGCLDEDNYDGTKSTTQSGLTCQRWDSISSNPHNVTDPTKFRVSNKYSLTHLNQAMNYCRIVEGVSRYKTIPWCFTAANGTSWEFCDVPRCHLD